MNVFRVGERVRHRASGEVGVVVNAAPYMREAWSVVVSYGFGRESLVSREALESVTMTKLPELAADAETLAKSSAPA